MPLFAKRRGSSAQPVHIQEVLSRFNANSSQPVNRSPSVGATAAAAAAGSAYMNRNTGSGSLSSAAAAAALRSHTTTPEPVGSIQTKRMVRRGSISSVASGSVAGAPPSRAGLQRRDSSGSMTERTFRSPSTSPSRANGAMSPDIGARPPVPPIPKTLRSGPGRRASSIEPPQRVMSPTLRNGNRSASVDRVNLQQQQRLSNVQESDDVSRRSSVNFSRPRFSPEPSETQVTRSGSRSGWFAGPTGSIPEVVNENPQSMNQAIANATTKPSRATSLPPVQTKQETEPVMVYDPNTRRFVQATRPKPVKQEPPPSPIVDTAPKLKPGEYDPATRSIVPGLAKTQPQAQAELEPPPRNPARLSPSSSPIITPQRPGGLLHKQPSMVREDPIAEREAEEAASPVASRSVSHKQAAAPSKSYASPARSHQRSTSLDVPKAENDPRGRDVSLSPSRSTRFSTATVLGGTRHEPQRGVSPVKSAMKHSPSSSIRTASPVATFSPLALAQSAPSDVSDTTSLTSAEGPSSTGKKRRSVRVSFDDEATEPVPPLPESKVAALASKDKQASTDVVSDEDGDDSMTPRPALPSFGSVRRNRVQNEVAEKVTESSPDRGRITPEPTATKPSESPLQPVVESTETTAPSSAAVEKPIPAIVTSQEPATDTITNEKSTVGPTIVPGINLQPPTPGLGTSSIDNASDDGNVSDRSGRRELQNLAQGVIFYGDESDDSRSRQAPPALVRQDSDGNEFVDAAEDQSPTKAGFASLDAIVETPVSSPTTTTAPATALTVDSDKANAAQTNASTSKDPASPTTPTSPSDWSATGAYWNKISKQSKANADKEKGQLSSDDEKPAKRSFFKRNKDKKNKDKGDAAPSSPPKTENAGLPMEDNSLAKAAPPVFGSGTTAPPDVQQTTAPPDSAAVTAPEPTQAPVIAQAKTQTASAEPAAASKPAAAPTQAVKQSALQPSPVITTTSKPNSRPNSQAKPIKSALKKTAPASVRSDDEGAHLPRTMRGPDALSKARPQSAQIAPRTAPSTSARPASAVVPKGFKVIDDDDSDSSFRKKRKGASSVGSDGRYNMRRSMRAGSVSSEQPAPITNGKRASSLRATSPASSTTASEFRHTMRGPPNSRSLRPSSSGPAQRNSSSAGTSMTARLKSRFADSDDEDTGSRFISRPFRSRFADSDEEDDTIAEELPPVRGIPRRHGQEDGDSTDLDDESDLASPPNSPPHRRQNKKFSPDESEIEKAMEAARRKLGLQTPTSATGEGSALNKGTMRDRDNDKVLIPMDVMSEGSSASGTRRKRGLMSLLRRNKSDNQNPASPTVQSPLATGTIPEEPQQDTAPASPASSPPGKLTRRLSSQPERQKLQRGNSALSTATAPAASTRPVDNEHWPLPPPIPQERVASFKTRNFDRPSTSGEGEEPTQELERPGNRRSFSARVGFTREAIAHSERDESVQGDGENAFSQRTGKKKRFGLLRRAFGLYD